MSVPRSRSRRTAKSKLLAKSQTQEWLLTCARIEGAVKQILCGMNVKTSASVANAECLDWYRDWAKTH
jgi:hypothetical protein